MFGCGLRANLLPQIFFKWKRQKIFQTLAQLLTLHKVFDIDRRIERECVRVRLLQLLDLNFVEGKNFAGTNLRLFKKKLIQKLVKIGHWKFTRFRLFAKRDQPRARRAIVHARAEPVALPLRVSLEHRPLVQACNRRHETHPQRSTHTRKNAQLLRQPQGSIAKKYNVLGFNMIIYHKLIKSVAQS